MVGPVAKREGVAHLQAVMGLSERRACAIVDADRKMIRYRSRCAPDTELRTQLRDLANARRRFGYRRLFILLRQEGEPSGINRIYRLYREEGLTVRKRRGRRRAVGTRPILLQEVGQPDSWANDEMYSRTGHPRHGGGCRGAWGADVGSLGVRAIQPVAADPAAGLELVARGARLLQSTAAASSLSHARKARTLADSRRFLAQTKQ